MEILKERLTELCARIHPKDVETFRLRLDNLTSIYPFNEVEFTIANLLGYDVLELEEYIELRDEYIERNLFLYIFEIAGPRTFGEQWAQGHLKSLVPTLSKPSKKVDPGYYGQYDFILANEDSLPIRVEVKASRAVDLRSREALFVKALRFGEPEKGFDMNFQQVKPACCDVFVWIGVWRDVIKFWVLSSYEVEHHRYFSVGQHRGNIGEGQLHIDHINILEFERFAVSPDRLKTAIIEAAERQANASRGAG